MGEMGEMGEGRGERRGERGEGRGERGEGRGNEQGEGERGRRGERGRERDQWKLPITCCCCMFCAATFTILEIHPNLQMHTGGGWGADSKGPWGTPGRSGDSSVKFQRSGKHKPPKSPLDSSLWLAGLMCKRVKFRTRFRVRLNVVVWLKVLLTRLTSGRK